MAKAGTNYRAGDAEAEAEPAPAVRPLTAAEREYLDQRAEDTANAVEVIEGKIRGMQETLKAAKAAQREALAARDRGAE